MKKLLIILNILTLLFIIVLMFVLIYKYNEVGETNRLNEINFIKQIEELETKNKILSDSIYFYYLNPKRENFTLFENEFKIKKIKGILNTNYTNKEKLNIIKQTLN